MPPQGAFRDAHSLTEALLDSDPRILTRPFSGRSRWLRVDPRRRSLAARLGVGGWCAFLSCRCISAFGPGREHQEHRKRYQTERNREDPPGSHVRSATHSCMLTNK